MCLLIYKPQGVKLNTEMLTNGARGNRDGWGCAILQPDGAPLIVRKGLNWNTDEVLEHPEWAVKDDTVPVGLTPLQFLQLWEDNEMVIHFRFSSAGGVNLQNVHPIHTGYDDLWVAHNGTMTTWATYQSPRSDTAQFAAWLGLLLSKQPQLREEETFWSGVQLMLNTNKVAIIEPSGVLILNPQEGTTLDCGTWVSNTAWKSVTTTRGGYLQKPRLCDWCEGCSCKRCSDKGGPSCTPSSPTYPHTGRCPESEFHRNTSYNCDGLKQWSVITRGGVEHQVCFDCMKAHGDLTKGGGVG